MKKLLFVLILLALFALCFGCKKEKGDTDEITKISFKESNSYESLLKLKDTKVCINGYMATSSPVDGSFIFLMNLPYQSCPFCKPNTSELSNTIEAYPKRGEKFNYTSEAIRVTGTLKVAEEGEYFTDRYDYQFSFKLVDAEYTIIQEDDLDGDAVLRTKVANAGIVTDLYKMFDYLNFVCRWNTYFVTITDTSHPDYPGYYLWPSDVKHYLYTEGAQYNYGYKSDYFDNLIEKINKVSPELTDLVSVVERSKVLAADAITELEAENYTAKKEYIPKFDKEDYVYTITNGGKLTDEYESIYYSFSDWYGI